MKKFILKLFVFFFILGVLLFGIIIISSWWIKRYDFKNWETESNLLVMKPNTHYDLLFMGNSHARNFSRHKNHLRVEEILNKKILNLGRSAGLCGIREYPFYLQYAYSMNISADTVIINIFSQMLYSDYQNKITISFSDEPFDLKFFLTYLKYPYAEKKYQRLINYIFSKLKYNWLLTRPKSIDYKKDSLTKIDTAAIRQGLKIAFANGFDTVIFKNNAKVLEELIKIAQSHGSTVIFITTPTLFGNWPRQEDVVKLMKYFRKKYGVKYYNFAEVMKNPYWFYDHHHLNSKGISIFTEKYLKPALEGDTTYLEN